MFNDRLCELEEIAKMLIEVRQKLEKFKKSRNVPGANALHSAISDTHWLRHCIDDATPPQTAQTFPAYA